MKKEYSSPEFEYLKVVLIQDVLGDSRPEDTIASGPVDPTATSSGDDF